MKKLIANIKNFVLEQNAKRWLCLLFGIIIATFVMAHHFDMAGRILLAVWLPSVLALVKELKFDHKLDALNIYFTAFGGFLGSMLSYLIIMTV